jgi:hypothetical protein
MAKNGNWNCGWPDNERRRSKTRQTRDSKTRIGWVSCATSTCLFSMFRTLSCPYIGVSGVTKGSPAGTLSELENGAKSNFSKASTAFNANSIGGTKWPKNRSKIDRKQIRANGS